MINAHPKWPYILYKNDRYYERKWLNVRESRKSITGSVPVMVILGSRSCSMIGYFAYDQFYQWLIKILEKTEHLSLTRPCLRLMFDQECAWVRSELPFAARSMWIQALFEREWNLETLSEQSFAQFWTSLERFLKRPPTPLCSVKI